MNNILSLCHGSMHKFLRFDLGKRGTGEGCATQGYGIYLTKSESSAQNYTGTFFTANGKDDFMYNWTRYVNFDGKLVMQDRDKVWHDISSEKHEVAYQNAVSAIRDKVNSNIYKVQFAPKNHSEEPLDALIMDWNNPIDSQPAIKEKLIKAGLYMADAGNTGRTYTPDNAANAARLKKAGILGLTYKGLNEDDRNYVIWDLSSLQIQEINDVPFAEVSKMREFRTEDASFVCD